MAGPIEAIATFCDLLRIDTPAQLSICGFNDVVAARRLNSAEWLVFADALEETGECRLAELAQKFATETRRREEWRRLAELAAIEREHRAAERRVFSDNY